MAILGDRPLGTTGIDRLGFEALAQRIATSLMDRASAGGLVVGIEGAWGSGKTSLIDLTIRQLDGLGKAGKPVVVNFRPWLIGDRESLLNGLFKELASAVDSIALESGDAGPHTKTKAKDVAQKIRNFGSKLGSIGRVIAVAGNGVPGMAMAGNVITALADAAKDTQSEKPLANVKDDLIGSLAELNRRIIVTIDDVDRLEPSEALEILRLVRSVGDFPNVIYLLCFDQDVLARGVEEAAKVKNGRAYLEKIIQASVRVPVPEEFRLRNWFEEELGTFAIPKNEQEADRLSGVIMSDGDLWLKTPRAVVKLLDELRFYWPAIKREDGDLADLVWLLMIKSGCPELYDWVEKYCSIMSVTSLGIGRASEREVSYFQKQFAEIAEKHGLEDIHYRARFSNHLLGVEPNYGKGEVLLNVFQTRNNQARDHAIAARRLRSPDHHRLYFALDLPSHSIRQADYDAFWAATDGSLPELEDLLLSWAGVPIAGKYTKCELLLERITAAPVEQFPIDRARRILSGFGNCSDNLFKATQDDSLFATNLWRKTEALFVILRDQMGEPDRFKFFKQLFLHAPALGWLSFLFRHDIFCHGVFGNERTPESEWLFSEKQFASISKIMLKRYQSLSLSAILSLPNAGTIFHTWRQAGDTSGPWNLVYAAIVDDDEALMDVLHAMASTIGTSDGTFSVIRKSDIGDFMDFDGVRSRIEVLAGAKGNQPSKKRAATLKAAFEAAKDY